MQQKLRSKGSGPFLLERNGQACGGASEPPLCCPRCGNERFCSLASLCAHLEYRHSQRPPEAPTGSFSITGKPPDPLTSAGIPWHDGSPPAYRGQQSAQRWPHARSLSDSRAEALLRVSGRRRTHSVGVRTRAEGEAEPAGEGEEDEEGENMKGGGDEERVHPLRLPFPPAGQTLEPDLDLVERAAANAASAAVRVLRAADGTLQRRLAQVSTELLCERAHSQHLAQERQEVAQRERWLSRQVDVAVMVIAALREQLSASENQLEQREREVITIQRFLEVAARQEKSGKVRIQRFIEDLLGRIALAERLLEFYQAHGSSRQQQPAETGSHPVSDCRSRSAGSPPSSSGLHDNRNRSSHSGSRRLCCRSGADRERLAQSSRLFCRPELRDDIWNQNWRRWAGHEA